MPQSPLPCRTRTAHGIPGSEALVVQPKPTAPRTGPLAAGVGLRPQHGVWPWPTLICVLVVVTALGLGWSQSGIAHPHPIDRFVAGVAQAHEGSAVSPGAAGATPVATSVPTLAPTSAPTSAPATPVGPTRPAPAPRSVAFPYWFLVLVVLVLVALVAIAATSAASRGPRERSGPPYPTA